MIEHIAGKHADLGLAGLFSALLGVRNADFDGGYGKRWRPELRGHRAHPGRSGAVCRQPDGGRTAVSDAFARPSLSSVWGVPLPKHSGITAATNLQPCDQVWFHHGGLVHHVATVMAVFRNLDFDRALWGDDPYPPSGFVFTLAEPQAARIAKDEINRLLGHETRFTWQGNLLMTEEMSRRLADAVELVLTD